ncbi:RDD family protein [Pseudomonas sp. MWU13-2105]|uniref:RDD family protein n=1 Tax=Pseudomonas sp. MWU13-2105 TaxID=2935074 RepID=UPI00200DB959|nr:RDD family protein [Pseudomonas sp. MWU13-2105]
MVTWWRINNGKKTGSVEVDKLKRSCQSKGAGSKNILWNESMDPWRPRDKVSEPYDLKAADSPSLLWSTDPGRPGDSSATRWPRFFARIFDTWWEAGLTILVLGAVLGSCSTNFVEWIHKTGANPLFSILCLPIAMLLDALLYRVFGNTPGKAWLGLKVETSAAKSLNFLQYLNRNFSIWASAFAFGVPFVNLFTMANQAHRLRGGHQTSYDESLNFRVRSKPLTWVRKITFGFAFVGVYGGITLFSSMDQATQREVLQHIMQRSYYWENPLTKLRAKLDSRWKFSARVNGGGHQVYEFSERTGHAVVVFAMQQQAGSTLDEYVRAFQKNAVTYMSFSGGGRFFEKEKYPYWQGYGGMVKDGGSRLKVKIVQSGSCFWRVVIIQEMPYDYTDVLVGELQIALWNTVK